MQLGTQDVLSTVKKSSEWSLYLHSCLLSIILQLPQNIMKQISSLLS